MNEFGLFFTIVSMFLLVMAGVVIWIHFKWYTALIVVGIPLFLASVDYFIPGDQTMFRQVIYILYAFGLYTLAMFTRARR